MRSPLNRVPILFLILVLGGFPFLTGCPSGSSTPTSGTPKPRTGTGTPPKHPDFLDGPMLREKQFTPQQMAEFDKRRDAMMFRMELATAPAMEGAAMLESLKASEYDESVLRHDRLRIFLQLTSEEILDEELARTILRMGETLRKSSQADKPNGILFKQVALAMVKSHDHLGETAKGDALLDESLTAMREFLRTTPVSPPANGPGVVIFSPAPSTAPSSPAPGPGEPPSGNDRESAARPASLPKPEPGSNLPHRVIMSGDGAVKKHLDWRQFMEVKATRLARRDFPAADAFVQKECDAARETMLAAPDDLRRVREWLSLTGLRATVARQAGHSELANEIDQEREERVRSLAETHPDSAAHYALHLTVRDNAVARLIRREPREALKRFEEIRAAVESSAFANDPAIAQVRQSWRAYDRMIEDSQFRQDLIGRPAPRFDVERWVHGNPLPLESLDGRVVLIAFCQVNTLRSVELYPWLNSLHEKWHDRGLEVIQVVRPSHLSWNATANRAEVHRERISISKRPPKIPDVTATSGPGGDPLAADRPVVADLRQPPEKKAPPDPAAIVEAEVRMLEQLATHYKHRFPTLLVPPAASMHDTYGAKAVPHLVVIDRKRILRRVEDVPDETTRKSIEESLEMSLAE